MSKRNLPNVGMGGWMEALADKVHKQGEHIPQQASHVKVFMACNVMVIVSFRNSLLWVSMFILSNLIMGYTAILSPGDK